MATFDKLLACDNIQNMLFFTLLHIRMVCCTVKPLITTNLKVHLHVMLFDMECWKCWIDNYARRIVLTCTRNVCCATFALLFDDVFNCCLPNVKPKQDFSSLNIVYYKIEFIPPGLCPRYREDNKIIMNSGSDEQRWKMGCRNGFNGLSYRAGLFVFV